MATRITWEESVSAFLITVMPHVEAVSNAYNKILKVNLTEDTYEVVKMNPEDRKYTDLQNSSLSKNIRDFIDIVVISCPYPAAFVLNTQVNALAHTCIQIYGIHHIKSGFNDDRHPPVAFFMTFCALSSAKGMNIKMTGMCSSVPTGG